MSIMFMKIRSVARGHGGNAVAQSAYIARDRLRDAATSKVHDYRVIPGLQHAEILLPTGTTAGGAEWARDRNALWNAAEAAERPRNARVAREYTVALPHELGSEARLELARTFAQQIADRYRTPVDLAVHGPSARGDPRNHHAHILATTRELDGNGFGRKATIELGSAQRYQLGLRHTAYEYRELRALWAGLANERLRDAHVAARLEPRSRATLAREQAREAAAVVPEVPAATATLPSTAPAERASSIEQMQQRAAAAWLAMREGQGRAPSSPRATERTRDRGLDAGLDEGAG